MPKIGEWVIAVGNPYGLGGTVTAGIVSAENRDIGSGPYDDFIQIDAPVNRGFQARLLRRAAGRSENDRAFCTVEAQTPAPSDGGQNKAGVVVIDVDPAGAAADAGIQAGDVILRVGERDIASPKEMRQALSDAKSRGRLKALVLVKSGGIERYVALPVSAV